jgi:hypothetical protein
MQYVKEFCCYFMLNMFLVGIVLFNDARADTKHIIIDMPNRMEQLFPKGSRVAVTYGVDVICVEGYKFVVVVSTDGHAHITQIVNTSGSGNPLSCKE